MAEFWNLEVDIEQSCKVVNIRRAKHYNCKGAVKYCADNVCKISGGAEHQSRAVWYSGIGLGRICGSISHHRPLFHSLNICR